MGRIFNFIRSPKGKALLLLIPAVIIPVLFFLSPRKPTGMWGAIASIVSSLVPLICIVLAFILLRHSSIKAGKAVGRMMTEKKAGRSLDAVVFRQMVGSSRLGVLSTIYTDVVMLKKSRAGGLFKSYGIYKYVGKIEGGIEHLDQCRFNVSHSDRTIYVEMPLATIIGHEIIKLEKFDERSTSFCKIENSEVMDEIQQRKSEAEQLLVEYGFMQEVEKRAQEVISGMIVAMDYSGYDIVYSWQKKEPPLLESVFQGEGQPMPNVQESVLKSNKMEV